MVDHRKIPYSRDVFGEMEEALIFLRGERDKNVVEGRITDLAAYKRCEDQIKKVTTGGFDIGRKYQAGCATDDLTGLLSPRYIRRELEDIAARRKREKGHVSVIFADIDHFKKINDEYGHTKGDIVLQRSGSALREVLRVGDELGRYAGDEFLAVVSDDLNGGKQVARKIRDTVGNLVIEVPGNEVVRITLSVGVACSDEVGYSPLELLRCADEAHYASKHIGRNAIHAWRGRDNFERVD